MDKLGLLATEEEREIEGPELTREDAYVASDKIRVNLMLHLILNSLSVTQFCVSASKCLKIQ